MIRRATPFASLLLSVAACGTTETSPIEPAAVEQGPVTKGQTTGETMVQVALNGALSSFSYARDAQGAPRVKAPNEALAYAGLCYAMAEDRLFQMDLLRRTAEGRVAEIVGSGPDGSVLNQDILFRVQGLKQVAEARFAQASARTRSVLTACAVGVNAFRAKAIATNRLPPEFQDLGYTPEPWKPSDSVTIMAFTVASLDLTLWSTKLQTATIAAIAGPEIAAALVPATPQSPSMFNASGVLNPANTFLTSGGSTNSVLAAQAPAAADLQPAASPLQPRVLPLSFPKGSKGLSRDITKRVPREFYGLGRMNHRASNAFAIDGHLTSTGKPMLANDPHLSLTVPTLIYPASIQVGNRYAVEGLTLPGFPAFISAHSKAHAWGLTFTVLDDADLYIETFRGAGSSEEVRYNGKWVPVQQRTEIVRVAGENPVTLRVKSTPHGPVLNAAIPDLDAVGPISLKTTQAQPEWKLDGFFALPESTTWATFKAQAQSIGIGLNFHFADQLGAKGHIGYVMAGLAPQRNPENIYSPVPGDDGLHEWTHYASNDERPAVYDPPSHLLVTANNRLAPSNYAPKGRPVYISEYYDLAWRAQRLHTRILTRSRPVRAEDAASFQLDTQTVHGPQIRDLLVAALGRAGLPSGDPSAANSRALLQNWDGNTRATSGGAAVFEVLSTILVRDMGLSVLGPDLFPVYSSSVFYANQVDALQRVLEAPMVPFFGATTSANAAAARDEAVKRALGETDALLRAEMGTNTSQWQWGKIHTLTYNHPLADMDPRFAIGTFPAHGDVGTVWLGGWFIYSGSLLSLPPADFAAAGGLKAAMAQDAWQVGRVVWNLGSLSGSLGVLATGTSGNPETPYFADQAPKWRAGQYFQKSFAWEK